MNALDRETARLVAGFEGGTLAELPHADHVRLGWAYARTVPLLDAIARMKHGLIRFATAHGAAEKYHETITWAFVVLIHERIARAPDATWEEFAHDHRDLFEKGALAAYYSKETLDSPLARKVFVLPAARGA